MIAMRMVQVAVDEIVDMVAMRHGLMPAVWAMDMRAMDVRRAVHGIPGVDRDDVLVDVIAVHVMQMAVVQIVNMAVMADCGVSALRAMLVRVVGVVLLGTCGHWQCSSVKG